MRFLRNMRFVRPYGPKISGVLDHRVNRYRCVVRITGSSASTSLPPFAPRPLRRFITTMKALTSVRVSPSHRSPCLTHTAVLTIPSPTTWRPLFLLYFRYSVFSGTGLLPLYHSGHIHAAQASETGLGFANGSQARRTLTAETGSLSYGLVVHLLLLPTSPRSDAVTGGYRL